MITMSVGEFKAKFSEVINQVLIGNEVGVSYGKKKETIGVMVPYKSFKKNPVRKLGIWKGKAKVKFAKDFKMTIDQFLNS